MTHDSRTEAVALSEAGQTAVEYAAVLLLVALAIVTVIATGFLGLLAEVPGRVLAG